MSQVYFASDLHIAHKNILKYRPELTSKMNFKSVEEHDKFILNNILKTVKKRDNLWLLGDICFDKNKLHLIHLIASKVNKLNIVLGNHDCEREYAPTLSDYLNIDKVEIFGMVKYNKTWLTHSPMHPQELRGKANIHGHTHSENIVELNNAKKEDKRYFNCSVDNIDYTPISYQEILQKLSF